MSRGFNNSLEDFNQSYNRDRRIGGDFRDNDNRGRQNNSQNNSQNNTNSHHYDNRRQQGGYGGYGPNGGNGRHTGNERQSGGHQQQQYNNRNANNNNRNANNNNNNNYNNNNSLHNNTNNNKKRNRRGEKILTHKTKEEDSQPPKMGETTEFDQAAQDKLQEKEKDKEKEEMEALMHLQWGGGEEDDGGGGGEEQDNEEMERERRRKKRRERAMKGKGGETTSMEVEKKVEPTAAAAAPPPPPAAPPAAPPAPPPPLKSTAEDKGFVTNPTTDVTILSSTSILDGGVSDDEFDMFSDSPPDPTSSLKPSSAPVASNNHGEADALADNYDDEEGYYKAVIGSSIAGRYTVTRSLGGGVFSSVLLCGDDMGEHGKCAVKVIRSNETMAKAAMKEVEILKKLGSGKGSRFIVGLKDDGNWRNHVYLVMELSGSNLREVLHKYGLGRGLSMPAVLGYSRQLLAGLAHMGNHGVVHADLKPDNILVSDDLKTAKIADLGSAGYEGGEDCVPTPYLVSRFYRAPEIILGLQWNRGVDLWSLGCTVYELSTGKVCYQRGYPIYY